MPKGVKLTLKEPKKLDKVHFEESDVQQSQLAHIQAKG